MHGCLVAVVVVQMIAWTAVSTLLLHRGISNLWEGQGASSGSTQKGYNTGVVMLVVASLMIVTGPAFLMAVVIEKCYRRHKFKKLPQDDLPPKYEEVVLEDMAPRYSSLFLNCENLDASQT